MLNTIGFLSARQSDDWCAIVELVGEISAFLKNPKAYRRKHRMERQELAYLRELWETDNMAFLHYIKNSPGDARFH